MTIRLPLLTLTKSTMLALILGSLQGCLIPGDRPAGEFGVGSISYEVNDPLRPELMTKATDDFRRLALQFWYPTDPHQHLRLSYYLEVVPKNVNSILDAPVKGASDQLPLVIMSHGLGANRNHSEFISESLAAQGYLVAGIDHAYYGGPVRFPNADVLSSIPNMLRFTGPNITDELLAEYFDDWLKDCDLVLEHINIINADPASPLFQRIDTQRIAMVSHSYGGAMGMQCATTHPEIVATVNMDGDLRGAVKDQGTSTPFMMIWPGNAENDISHRLLENIYYTSPTFYWASIINSQHGDFTDHNRLLNPGGTPNIKRKQDITLKLIHAFLSHHLLNQTTSVLNELNLEAMPEIRFGVGFEEY